MAERIFIEARSVAEALREAGKKLSKTSDTARLDAELLMAHVLDVSRSELLLRRMRSVPPKGFAELIERRALHEPVAYIIGHQEFYGLELAVNRDVLIPRGDSEVIVNAALEACPNASLILDLGTGSGALLLAVLSERPAAQGVGIDSSSDALKVASDNAASLGFAERTLFLERNWTREGWATGLGPFDLILANPPYVEFDADLSRDVRDYEPATALFAGDDGLDDYRILVPLLQGLLTETGIAVLEIGATQAEAVSALAKAAGFTVQLHRDLADRPRALLLARGL